MPVSPTADTPASKDVIKDGEDAPINVEELAEEMKDGDEDDPTVSHTNTPSVNLVKGGFQEPAFGVSRLSFYRLRVFRDCPFGMCVKSFTSLDSCVVNKATLEECDFERRRVF